MAAYVMSMAVRLVELHRVLKPTGSLYLHCDPTASHYLKLVMDAVFGAQFFRNEIVWQRTGAHNDANRWGRVTDSILFYTKTDTYTFNPQYVPYEDAYIKERYHYRDEKTGRLFWPNTMTAADPGPARVFRGVERAPPKGTHWRFSQERIHQMEAEGRIYYSAKGMPYVKSFLDEQRGRTVQNLWTDIRMSKSGAERIGYATQKPLALLQRIIAASSNEGDMVLDPFCGCGTTIDAAHRLRRRWIGIDSSYTAVETVEKRVLRGFGEIEYFFNANPTDEDGARALAARWPHGFQEWAVRKLNAAQTGVGGRHAKVGGDRGIDGVLNFHPSPGKDEKAIVSVKGGTSVMPSMVRELVGTIGNEGAAIGVLVTVRPPTASMEAAAATAGTVAFEGRAKRYQRIQLISVADIFAGVKIDFPGYAEEPATALPAGSWPGENMVLPGMEGPRPRASARRGAIVELTEEQLTSAVEEPAAREPVKRSRKPKGGAR